MMFRFISLLFLFTISELVPVFAQNNFVAEDSAHTIPWQNGFVILFNNDTLFGQTRKRHFNESQKMDFRDTVTGKKVVYTVGEIKAFNYGEALFLPVDTNSARIVDSISPVLNIFGKMVVNGYAKLIVIDRELIPEDNQFIVKIRGTKSITLNKSMFEQTGKKQLAEYFSDDTELSAKILNADFAFEDLYKIVKHYNDWRRSLERMTNKVK